LTGLPELRFIRGERIQGRQRLVDQIEMRRIVASKSPLQRCAGASKFACFFLAAMVWRHRGRSMKLFGSACILVAGLAVLLLVAGGLFVMKLSHAPIVIDGLGPKIAEGLDAKFGRGLHFELGETSIIKHGYGPALGINGLSVKGRDGQTVFSSRYAEVTVDPLSLVIGKVTPKRLDVAGVTIKLAVMPDGALTISGAAEGDDPNIVVPTPVQKPTPAELAAAAESIMPNAPPVPTLESPEQAKPKIPRSIIIRQAASAMRLLIDTLTNPESSIAAIDHVGVKSGKLVVDDLTSDQTTDYTNLTLAFDKDKGATKFHLSTEGPNGPWQANLTASGAPGEERRLDIGVANISLDEIALASGKRSLGVDFDMPVSSQFSVVLTPDGIVESSVGTFKLGSGYFRLDDPDDEPMMVDDITGRFHWEPSTRRIVMDEAKLSAGPSQFVAAGVVTPPVYEGDAFAANFFLSKPGIFGAKRPGEKPLTIEHGDFAARLMTKEKRFVIDRLSFSGADFGFAMAGDVDWREGPHLRLGASINPSPVQVVERFWPSSIAASVRSWFLDHFKGGTLETGTLRVDLDEQALKMMRADLPPPDDASSIDFTVTGGTLHFLPGVPPLKELVGSAHISGRQTKVAIASGTLETASGQKLTLTDGGFTVPDASIKPTPAVAAGRVTGSIEAVKDLLAYEAFKGYASMPIDTPMHGQVDGRLEVGLKVGPGSEGLPPQILINANATNFSIEKLIGKEKLDNATLSVNVDQTGMKASGQGKLFGVPAVIEMSKPLGNKPAEATLSFTTDDAARSKQGLSAIPGVSGAIGTKISAVMNGDKQKALVELDLTKTAFDGILPGFSKPSGVPGKASFIIAPGDDSLQVDQISVDMGPMQLRGSVELGSDQSLNAAKFSQVRLSPGDDMKIDVAKGNDTYKITIRGTTIDARPFLRPFSVQQGGTAAANAAVAQASKESDVLRNVDIDLKTGILTGYNKKSMTNLELRFVRQNNALKQLSLSGRFGKDQLSGLMTPGSSQVQIVSEDAGSLLSFIDLYKHMEDGRLNSVLTLKGEESLLGRLEIKDFVLRDEPAMQRLAAAGAVQNVGPDRAHPQKVDTSSVPFKRLQVSFQRAGSRLELREGTMYGTEFGLTVDGMLDFPHDKVALNGTFVPAYEVNNLFSKIPVFGLFLGGGSNEGLFAVNYTITGAASAPSLNVNPLSAIAPGFLRKIFGAMDPNNPQQELPFIER